jgi:hypothetical protein
MRATLRWNLIGKRHAKMTQRNAPTPITILETHEHARDFKEW